MRDLAGFGLRKYSLTEGTTSPKDTGRVVSHVFSGGYVEQVGLPDVLRNKFTTSVDADPSAKSAAQSYYVAVIRESAVHIAATTRSLWEMPFAAACSQLQDLGFDKVELTVNNQLQQLTVDQIVSNMESTILEFREASRLSPVALLLEDEVSMQDFTSIVKFCSQLRIAQVTIQSSELGTPFNSEIDRLKERNRLCIEEGIRLSILTRSGRLTEDPHTALELCQSVKSLGITLDPSYYTCTPRGAVNYDMVFPKVSHLHLRDTSTTELQVPGGLGEIDYNRIISMLENESFDRVLSIDLLPKTMEGEERLLEMRKLRLLLESLL